eukprot:CAMPEP_0168568306 /NCGR_PEP_ID=MMETSP0413-20121227/15503_1 /TAXON_ID=136452 /ORGANISM="Filamoeba nolandi, Strain NC-AS-23-1" /LENGTH=188 /DNA_ID=CAMNT_0008600625 /DNA_START=111 /DNA_END=674 /DNA_ORIENTATION=+
MAEQESILDKTISKLVADNFRDMFGAVLDDNEDTPHQILPFLYLGSINDARSFEKLKKNDISFVLNMAHLNPRGNLDAQTAKIYEPLGITYKGIETHDVDLYQIKEFFEETYDFIMQAANSDKKILVHCAAGVSRSATIVIAFLLKYHKEHGKVPDITSVQDAIRFTNKKRACVCPNKGFMSQLYYFG